VALDCPCVSGRFCITGFSGQVRSKGAVDIPSARPTILGWACQSLLPGIPGARGQGGAESFFGIVPRYCYQLNNNELPFGCHAWENPDKAFREPFLLKWRVPRVRVFYGAPPLLCSDILVDPGDDDGAPVRVVPEQRHAVAIASVPATE